jgi:hypothetical protein
MSMAAQTGRAAYVPSLKAMSECMTGWMNAMLFMYLDHVDPQLPGSYESSRVTCTH